MSWGGKKYPSSFHRSFPATGGAARVGDGGVDFREREIQLLVVAMETKKSLGPLIGDGSFDAPTTRYGIVDPQTTAAPFVFCVFVFY